MVFAPVKPEIKQKVVDFYLAGYGRNRIDRELHQQGVKVSHGSISNIINNYRRQQQPQQPLQVVTIPATEESDSYMTSPSSNSEETGNYEQDIDFDNQAYEHQISEDTLYERDYDPALVGLEGEKLLGCTTEPEQVRQETASKDLERPISDTRYVPKEIRRPESSSQTKEIKKDSEPQSEDTGLMDWDTTHQSRFTKWIIEQRRRRQVELDRLSLYWKDFKRERKKFDERKKEFEAAEDDLAQKIRSVKDLIPIAAKLKEIGFEFSHANAWIHVIKEYASKKMIDERTAVWRLCDDLKSWQELDGFETAIQNAKHQLELLDIVVAEKKAAISTLVDLRKSGMTENEIMNLTRVVNGWGNGNGSGFKLDTSINCHGADNAEDGNN